MVQALGTTLASDGMEACRRCCGGHGYSLPSGLPTLFTSYVQNATWEGDNNVMYLQVQTVFSLISTVSSPATSLPCCGRYFERSWRAFTVPAGAVPETWRHSSLLCLA